MKNCVTTAHRAALVLMAALMLAPPARAQTGTWNVDANGLWSTATNWLSNTIANGSGSTANFTNDITADRTVSLDSDRTLTNVVFGDSVTSTAGSWILNNNSVSTNNLILAGTTPTITVNALGTGKTATISAEIQGTVGLTKGGTGTLVLSGANTYSGGTTILNGGGTLRLESLGSLGAGNVTIQTNGANTGTLELALTGTNVITNTFSGFSSATSLSGGGQAHILNTSGTNTINSTLDIANTGGNGLNVVSNGGLLTLAGTITTDENFRVLSLGGSGNGVVSGAITQLDSSVDAMNVYKSGSGTWSLTSNSNTYNRRLLIFDGSLQVGNGGTTGALSAGQDVIFDATATPGAKLVFNRSDNYGYGSAAVEISGPGSVEQVGAGTTTLSGINTYTGTTTVSAGTLFVNGSLAAGSAVSVGASGALGGTGTINGAATIFGTHTPGNSPGIQTFASNLTYSGGSSTVEWELVGNTITNAANPNAVYDQILVNGSLDFAGATSLSLLFNGPGSSVLWANPFWDTDQQWTLYDVAVSTTNFGNLSLAAGSYLDSGSNPLASARPNASFNVVQSGSDVLISYVAVPEPSTLALAGLGLASGLGWILRRRRG